MIDIKDIISIALGTTFGGLISWWLSRYYWLKSKPLEAMATNIRDISIELRKLNISMFSALRTQMVFERNKQYFSADAQLMEILPQYESSKRDVPQIEWCRASSNIIAGTTFKILMKVVDLGLNFENPNGATITDHRGNLAPVEDAGFGCMFATINTTLVDQGKYYLTIKLVDVPEGGGSINSCTQRISFFIRS
ncbi:MAG: hypothetical protein WBK51_02520 [Polaromonas sp.]